MFAEFNYTNTYEEKQLIAGNTTFTIQVFYEVGIFIFTASYI